MKTNNLFVVYLSVLSIGVATPAIAAETEPRAVVSRIPRVAVQSKALASLGFSKRRHILEIQFSNGAVYRYYDVPPFVYRDLITAESKGGYCNEYQTELPICARPATGQGQRRRLKDRCRLWWEGFKRRFVFTSEEKRVVIFVLTALALGFGAQSYRARHPAPLPARTDKKQSESRASHPVGSPLASARKERKRRVQKPERAVETDAPLSAKESNAR